VGQQRLHKAIQAFRNDNSRTVQVEWKPFQIDPQTAPLGETVDDYCSRRWGGAGWTQRLKSEGRKDGADFGNWKWWPNTSKAHQLIQYCGSKGISSSDRVNALLFRAEYEKGENISLVDVLVGIGKEAASEQGSGNIDEEDLKRYLTLNEGRGQVKEEIQHGRQRYGISSVPYFIVTSENNAGRPYGFSGAQSSETFVDVFEELEGLS
jgi:predicted DsbA family dithiol-disulfide isomerase